VLNLNCLVAVYSDKVAYEQDRFFGGVVVVGCSKECAANGDVATGQGTAKGVAVDGDAHVVNFIRETWHGITPGLSAALCSAIASHIGFRSTSALRAVTIQLTSLPSVARRALRAALVIMGR